MSVEDIRDALYVVLSDSDISDKILTHYYSNHNHPGDKGPWLKWPLLLTKENSIATF